MEYRWGRLELIGFSIEKDKCKKVITAEMCIIREV